MTIATALHPQFVTNGEGRQTAVLLPIEEYHELLEDLDDLTAVAERIGEPTFSHKQVVADLREDGYISD